jgi:hypothetical protein
MTVTPETLIAEIATEDDAIETISLLTEKFGLKTHVWGTKAVEDLLEEAGIDAGIDTEALGENKAQVIADFKETQAWQETGLDNDIAMQDALIAILEAR